MFGIRYPIIQAPMAGGIDTPELVAAVSEAGGLGSIGAAYLSPAQISAAIARVRALTDQPFAVNLFAVDSVPLDRDPAPMLALLKQFYQELGLPAPVLPDRPAQNFAEQAEAILNARVPVFSFTFGIPDRRWLAAFRAAGTKLVGTATTVREAVLLQEAGVDAVVAQGSEAGGHRGTFSGPFEDGMVPTMTLVREMVQAVRLPVIASGGIMDGAAIRTAISAGAAAVQLGTAFIPCLESGASQAYKSAILPPSGNGTAITRAFSGRPARGIRNRVMTEVDAHPESILPYPWQNAATRPLRTAAAKAGKAEYLSLWAGEGFAAARSMPAAELVGALVREAELG